MKQYAKVLMKIVLPTFAASYILFACAVQGAGPQGGPYDFDPPVLVDSKPSNNSLNFDGKNITLYFNKNVELKDVSQKVIITPPQKRMPQIYAANKKVHIELRDSLQENTTYVIDFSDAVQDVNQNNPIDNFSFIFSTGNKIDSLQVSGKVIKAFNNEPLKNYYVGLHSNLNDSAFFKLPFEKISKTNENGEFTIKGVAEGEYHIFALEDKGREYKYTNPNEVIAFSDQIIIPTTIAEGVVKSDTIFRDQEKLEIDTIITKTFTKYLPDDILLRAFESSNQRQYFRNAVRSDQHRFELNFGKPTQKPIIRPLNFADDENWHILERTMTQDSIYMYWITHENIIKKDSLWIEMTYQMTDTLDNLVTAVDSLYIVDRNKRKNDDKNKKKKIKENDEGEEQVVFLNFKNNVTSSFNIYDTIKLEFGEPLLHNPKEYIFLSQKFEGDTVYTDINYQITQDTLNPRIYNIINKWNYNQDFKIRMDSAKVFSYYGFYADKWEQNFKIKQEDEYANLIFTITGINTKESWIMQLLDEKETVLRQITVRGNNAVFKNVLPGTYFAKLIQDKGNNKRWTTGDYRENKQPDRVYYFPSPLNLRAYWDDEETFVVDTLSFNKPVEILINKPKDKSEREKMMEKLDEERNKKERDSRNRQNDMMNQNNIQGHQGHHH